MAGFLAPRRFQAAGWRRAMPIRGLGFGTLQEQERGVSHYSLEELVELWRREKLTADQMIGQLLQALLGTQQRLRELERRLPPATDAAEAPRPAAPPPADRRR